MQTLPANPAFARASLPDSNETYALLHTFSGAPADGAYPEYGLTEYGGKFYGATCNGGKYNAGTVYEVSASGAERTLYSFQGGVDGACAYTGLVYVNGMFYGTTTGGGSQNCQVSNYQPGCGTVFAITPAGKEHVVYRFQGGPDGSTPQVTLLYMNGLLYGVTAFGANCTACGTVFSVTTSGKEKTLYRFKSGTDGADALAPLIAVNGVMYGTTADGGKSNAGTVFSVTTSGKETVLYRFQGGTDGEKPWANLVEANGVLYGSTLFGGGTGCARGCGTLFSITTAGKEKVVHSFGNGAQGSYPIAAMTYEAGALYGGTTFGALQTCKTFKGNGCGSLFKLTTSGQFSIVHKFTGPDGAAPQGALVPLHGALYGTAFQGGTADVGTIFKFTP
ncbi:MAG: hypothetical protein JO199_12090 [Candidatus Eremiobacteraeota bacterium]|nr:hypothetical protein [Candidatus Eremiobacteraeota bacterium]